MQHQAKPHNHARGFKRELKHVDASQARSARVQELEGVLTDLEAQHASVNEAAQNQHAEVSQES